MANHWRTHSMEFWAKHTTNSPILYPRVGREASTFTFTISKYRTPLPVRLEGPFALTLLIRITPSKSNSHRHYTNASDENVRSLSCWDLGVESFQQASPHPWILSDLPLTRIVPELRIYRFWDRPIGPHPVAMFEVNLFTPAQFGAFVPWLVINRGPLSALLHPNTVESEDERNHTQRATWLGDRLPLDTSLFKKRDSQPNWYESVVGFSMPHMDTIFYLCTPYISKIWNDWNSSILIPWFLYYV